MSCATYRNCLRIENCFWTIKIKGGKVQQACQTDDGESMPENGEWCTDNATGWSQQTGQNGVYHQPQCAPVNISVYFPQSTPDSYPQFATVAYPPTTTSDGMTAEPNQPTWQNDAAGHFPQSAPVGTYLQSVPVGSLPQYAPMDNFSQYASNNFHTVVSNGGDYLPPCATACLPHTRSGNFAQSSPVCFSEPAPTNYS